MNSFNNPFIKGPYFFQNI
uniref:Uncharacterized protein n=1 Tax=Anguilla anguilla TaxID=7936 RepID=A0A0E9QU67_ANGAN